MKKIIGVLALVLLFTASTQAAVVLMDENFDGAAPDVDLDTLPGWVNNNGAGVGVIQTSNSSVEPVDVGRGISLEQDAANYNVWTSYSYAVSDVTLGAGEFYRFEAFFDVHDSELNSSSAVQAGLTHSDGRSIGLYIDPLDDLTQDTDSRDQGGARKRHRIYPDISGEIRVRMDVGPDGVQSWYDNGAGWVWIGEALASENATWGFTGGIVDVGVTLFAYEGTSAPDADTFSLVVLPEPATLAVLALGGFAVLLRRKR